MENPFLPTAKPRFVDREELIRAARDAARRMAESNSLVKKVLLFGSFARGDYSARSDLDLLVILDNEAELFHRRVEPFLAETPPYPSDVLVCTERELENALASRQPFIGRILREAIELYP
jgi:predicted nucleotidyltransferase